MRILVVYITSVVRGCVSHGIFYQDKFYIQRLPCSIPGIVHLERIYRYTHPRTRNPRHGEAIVVTRQSEITGQLSRGTEDAKVKKRRITNGRGCGRRVAPNVGRVTDPP